MTKAKSTYIFPHLWVSNSSSSQQRAAVVNTFHHHQVFSTHWPISSYKAAKIPADVLAGSIINCASICHFQLSPGLSQDLGICYFCPHQTLIPPSNLQLFNYPCLSNNCVSAESQQSQYSPRIVEKLLSHHPLTDRRL